MFYYYGWDMHWKGIWTPCSVPANPAFPLTSILLVGGSSLFLLHDCCSLLWNAFCFEATLTTSRQLGSGWTVELFYSKNVIFFSFAHFRLQIDAHWFLGNLKIHVVFTIFLASRYNHWLFGVNMPLIQYFDSSLTNYMKYSVVGTCNISDCFDELDNLDFIDSRTFLARIIFN